MTAIELVKWKLSKKETIILIMDDDEAKKVLTAWQVSPCYVKDFKVVEDAEPLAVLASLWNKSSFDMSALSAITGIPETRLHRIYSRLRNAHLIWPDGTISEQSSKLLMADQAAYIKKRYT